MARKPEPPPIPEALRGTSEGERLRREQELREAHVDKISVARDHRAAVRKRYDEANDEGWSERDWQAPQPEDYDHLEDYYADKALYDRDPRAFYRARATRPAT